MKIGVRLKIDVTKIDKALLFKGKKGTYLNATAFIDLAGQDQYGNNGMITQDPGKDSKDKGPILGNSQLFWSDSGSQQQTPQQQQSQQQAPAGGDDWEDSIPFAPYEKELYQYERMFQVQPIHDDYAKPLSVRWLCGKCHTAWHQENGEGLNAAGQFYQLVQTINR